MKQPSIFLFLHGIYTFRLPSLINSQIIFSLLYSLQRSSQQKSVSIRVYPCAKNYSCDFIPTRINTDLTDFSISSCCSEANNNIRVNPCLSVCQKYIRVILFPHGLTRISRIITYHPVAAKPATKIRVNPCPSVCQKIYSCDYISTRINTDLTDSSRSFSCSEARNKIRVYPCQSVCQKIYISM